MSRSRNPTTTSVESGELPIQEFIRRQRLRNESISCNSSPRRNFSPTPSPLLQPPPPPPPSAIPSPAPPPRSSNPPNSPPTWPTHLTPLLTLLLLLSTIHHLLGPTLQPLRFRTYNSTTSQITRLHFLTTILPTTLLHPGGTANTPTRPPPPPPFAPLNPTYPYAFAARTSLQHLLALHAPVAAAHVPVLAGVRHAAYPAVRALGALEARLDEGGEEGEGSGAVAARVADVRDAVHALQRASERWAVASALVEGDEGVEGVLLAGLREVGGLTAAAGPPAGKTGKAEKAFLWWRAGLEAQEKKGNEQAQRQRIDWRLQTACQAAAFERTLDEVEERRVPAPLGLAEDVRRTAGMVDKAVLGACRGVGEVLERVSFPSGNASCIAGLFGALTDGQADLVCADALAVLWREFEPRGSVSLEDIEGIWKAKVEAAAAAEATIKDLEILKEEVRMQRDGIDVWMMFLERVPGETVEEKCQL